MLIDCDTCAMRDLACGDCVVPMILSSSARNDPSRALEMDETERRAIEVLADEGLVPHLRLVPLFDPRAEGAPAARAG